MKERERTECFRSTGHERTANRKTPFVRHSSFPVHYSIFSSALDTGLSSVDAASHHVAKPLPSKILVMTTIEKCPFAARRERLRSMMILAAITLIAVTVSSAPGSEFSASGPLRSSLLANPLTDFDEIVFAHRVSGRDHWYGNFGHYSDDSHYTDVAIIKRNGKRFAFGEGARLCRLNLRIGQSAGAAG